MTTEENIREALEIARSLIEAGVPVFAAAPVEGKPGHYHLPKHWEKTVPSMVWLEKWRPGWGLAAVGGHVCDFLDGDPRNGAAESIRELQEGSPFPEFPMTFGRQKTPSGGDHWIVACTGLRKSTGFMPGLDLQAGAEDGTGRGFVWIAPTVRPSKDPSNAGELVAYRWEQPPDLELLKEAIEDARDSMNAIVDRIEARRAAPRERELPTVSDDDPFLSASQISGLMYGDRSFTLQEAQDFCRPALLALQAARVGEIEEHANIAATALSHFVPAFWSADQAFELLETSLKQTAYDPNGPSDWTAEKFRAVLDGRRPPRDNWKASVKVEPAAAPAVVVEAGQGEEELTVLERLRRKLVTAQELADSPTPDPLVHGLLDMNTEAWLIGAPGTLKSFVALDLAGHVGRGAEWQRHRVERRPVLYIAAEGQGGMVLRTRAWMKEHGDMEGVTFLPYPVQVKSNDGQWDALTTLARELAPGLIVIDTQARVSVGLEENSATDMGILVDAVGRLKRATGACVLVIHHTGRNGGDARGSSALDGAQDTELKVIRAEPRSLLRCKVVMDKQKDMAEGDGDGITLQLKVVDLGLDPHTGRDLSSLVVGDYDPFAAEQDIAELELDVTVWDRIRHPESWTRVFVPNGGKFMTRALQVLHDHAGQRGITKAEAYRIVVDRWSETPSKRGVWDAAWSGLVDLDVLTNVGGERWAVDMAAVRAARESAPNPSGGDS